MTPEPPTPDDEVTRVIIGVGAGVWEDLAEDIELVGAIERMALLPGATVKGLPTVEVLIRLTDGRLVHANTTWRLWEAATNAFGNHESTWTDVEERRPL